MGEKVSAADEYVVINETNFPDPYFRAFVANNLDIVADGKLSKAERDYVTEIRLEGLNSNDYAKIRDLTGIEHFTKLVKLVCTFTELSYLDLSRNTDLEICYVDWNYLTTLDVRSCTKLRKLSCDKNNLKDLEVGNNPLLDELSCSNNKLTTLDVSNNPQLDMLTCDYNNISKLDLSHNTEITMLSAVNTGLTHLSITNCIKLNKLYIEDNSVDALELSSDSILCDVYQNGKSEYYGETVVKYYLGESPVTPISSMKVDKATKIVIVTPQPAATSKPTATVTAKPTATSTGKPTATPTRKPATTTVPTNVTVTVTATPVPSVKKQGLADFIERLYNVALGRPSEAYGKNYWIAKVMNEGFTGADVARGFLFSNEFLDKNMSNSDFLDVLYKTFFDRAADSHKADWLTLMDQGWTKMQVIDGFINSTEWANLCLNYGIASGSNCKPNIVIAPSGEVESFARRLYTTCLGRDADPAGLNDWATQLANMQISGSQAAHGFFFSDEFIAHGFSNEEYVNRLYRTFMGREADPAGFADWTGQLAAGASRESVFQGFAGSAEWAGICAEYGILK